MRDMLGTVRGYAVPIALLLSLFVPVFFAGAALGTKFHLWDWRFGLAELTFGIGPLLLLGAAGLAVLTLLLALIGKPMGGLLSALLALAIPAAGLLYANQVRTTVTSLPMIHDISTDRIDPPMFSNVILERRGADSNPVGGPGHVLENDPRLGKSAGRPLADVQAEAYPDILPIRAAAASPQKAFDAALTIADRMGLEIANVDPGAMIIEGTAETFWYGFKDDVVIRIRPDGVGAVIDIRSVSRVGLSDMGANANRIRKFSTEVKKLL